MINLSNLYKMVEILHRNQITDINLALLIKEMSSEYSDKQERQKALDALAVCQSYEDAFIFGHVSMLDVTNVVLKQVSLTLNLLYWHLSYIMHLVKCGDLI